MFFLRILVLLFFPGYLMAATFVVNDTSDKVDFDTGDGVCAATALGRDCTLRAAIMQANATAGADTVSIPAGTYALTIDGDDDTALAGDLDILDEVTIEGAGRDLTFIDGNDIDRVFHTPGSTTTITDLTIQNGLTDEVAYRGGAIQVGGSVTALFERVHMTGNRANAGGAILGFGSSQITVRDSLFTGNELIDLGISNLQGPAFFCRDCDLVVESSTFSQNVGGGYAITVHDGVLQLINTTVSGNGTGGVRIQNADAEIKFSTLADNGTAANISYFSFDDGNVFEIGSSILQHSSSNNCGGGSDRPTSTGYNVLDDSTCGFMSVGDLENTLPNLGPLQDNGGSTATHLPESDSPVIDFVPMGVCTDLQDLPLTTDQRGILRPSGVLCDSGSVEFVSNILFQDGFETP